MAAGPAYSVGTIAKLLMLSERRVQQLTKEGVFPKVGRGQYELAPVIQGYIKHLQSQIGGTQESIDYRHERARKERALAAREEFDLSVLKKEYVHISHLERVLTRFASSAGAAFDSIAARLHQKYPELKSRHIDGIRSEIAGVRNYVAGLKPDPD